MRILVIVHGFPPAAQGGSEIYAETHARALREQYGDDILVLTREQDRDRPEYGVRMERRDGLQIAWINNTFRDARSFEQTYRNPAIGRIAESIIDDFAPDVAHIHHLTCLSTTIVRSLAARGIPRFLTLHDYWLLCHRGQLLDVNYQVCDGPEPSGCHDCLGPASGAGQTAFIGASAIRSIERRLPEQRAKQLRRYAESLSTVVSGDREADEQARRRLEHMREVCADITHFIAPSRQLRDRFVRFGVEAERITVAGYGFRDTGSTGATREPSKRPLRLGFLGSLMISKAPHVLLEAADRLPRGSVTIDLIGAFSAYHGDDRYREVLRPLIRRDGVRVTGPIANGEVPRALAAIDVLVVPSIWPENSPLVIQEAFLAGIPVVASRIGGIPEVVHDGVDGLLFTPGDPADLARQLARLIEEPGLLAALGRGTPSVRTIAEDVDACRRLYQQHLISRRQSMPRLAAVVLNFRTPDETLLTIRSLLASRRPIDDVIVVNNDEMDETRSTLEPVWSQISYLHTGRNLGFSGGMNVGIQEALKRGAARVLLVNSDVIVPPGCIERLEQTLDAGKSTGIVGPIVMARQTPDRIASAGMQYRPLTGRMRHARVGDRIRESDVPAHAIVDGVSGCVMLIRREVFDAVGLLHEDYFFSFEDLDFCLAARRAGFATVITALAKVYHEGGQSIGATSARRLYFAARNHLLLTSRDPSTGRLLSLSRCCSVVALNVAHAVVSRGGSMPARLAAVARGTRDYFAGRFGADSAAT